jgi:hypothetical protein
VIALGANVARYFGGSTRYVLHGTAVRLTLEYVSRKIGDPGTRKGLGLAQLQARF